MEILIQDQLGYSVTYERLVLTFPKKDPFPKVLYNKYFTEITLSIQHFCYKVLNRTKFYFPPLNLPVPAMYGSFLAAD